MLSVTPYIIQQPASCSTCQMGFERWHGIECTYHRDRLPQLEKVILQHTLCGVGISKRIHLISPSSFELIIESRMSKNDAFLELVSSDIPKACTTRLFSKGGSLYVNSAVSSSVNALRSEVLSGIFSPICNPNRPAASSPASKSLRDVSFLVGALAPLKCLRVDAGFLTRQHPTRLTQKKRYIHRFVLAVTARSSLRYSSNTRPM